MATRVAYLIALLLSLLGSLAAWGNPLAGTLQPRFLPADQVFVFSFTQQEQHLNLKWTIAPGYYLYRQQFKLVPQRATLAPMTWPVGLSYKDATFGTTEVYQQQVTLDLVLQHAAPDAVLEVTYQGCAAAGFCYPPQTQKVLLNPVKKVATPLASAVNRQSSALPFSPLWALLLGIGVAFTPCVLPLYPLITHAIRGRQRGYTLYRLLALALSYVHGMAVAYVSMGLIIASSGFYLQALLQHKIILFTLSVLFVLLALSMFGLYRLALPASLQTYLDRWSQRQSSGSLSGVFLMGALAGLVCSPCTTAPLSALLLYIAQSGNRLMGSLTLYLYAMGIGLPLVLFILFGQKVMPKRGRWMQIVQEGMGFVILIVPIVLLSRVLAAHWEQILWSLLGISFFGWAFCHALSATGGIYRLLQILFFVLAIACGAPLQRGLFTQQYPSVGTVPAIFAPITDDNALMTKLTQNQGRFTLVDLYAEWCSTCKLLDANTFSDPAVQQALKSMQLLRIDMTEGNMSNSPLLQKMQVFGLPTLLFFDDHGKEIANARIVGFIDASTLLQHLQGLQQTKMEP